MNNDSLSVFIDGVRLAWGPLSSDLVKRSHSLLESLAQAPSSEPWLEALLREAPEDRELYRDPVNGFVLLAHVEREGRYRIPHDHGNGWVIYAVQHGEMEMGSYARVIDSNGSTTLVQRDRTRVRAGECRVYLPGDIHDTRCVSNDVLMFRFTSCDLKVEAREGRLTRFAIDSSPRANG